MQTQCAPQFGYESSFSFRSFVWSWWLRVPPNWRGAVYRMIIRLFGHQEIMSLAIRLPFGIYAKYCLSANEAYATEFVRTHTTIPIPQVLDALPYSGYSPRPWLMISTRVPGSPLFKQGSGHRLINASETQVTRVKEVLSDWIEQLRALPSPYGGRVCGFLGGPLVSFRIGDDAVGPFDSVAHFHAQPFCTVWSEYFKKATPQLQQLISDRSTKKYKMHLVHGDLLLHNILADDEMRPTGLIDWECAAWMPEYWETASSTRSMYRRMWCWKEIVRDAFPKYDDDIAIEYQIQLGYDP